MKTVLPRVIRTSFILKNAVLFTLFLLLHYVSFSQATCAAALELLPATTCTPTSGSILGAVNSGVANPSCGGTVRHDMWYQFQATSTNPVITVTVTGANFKNSGLQIMSGACGGLGIVSCVTGIAATGTFSLNATGLTIGTIYYIRLYTTNTSTATTTANGAFTICVVGPPPPANDDCLQAVSLTSGTTCTNTGGSVINATPSAGVPAACTGTVKYDVWYSFVAQTTNPTITLSSIGTNFTNPNLQLFSGTCGALVSVACGTPSIAATGLTLGNTYFVRVYSTSVTNAPSTLGAFNICVTDPPPANDDCAGAVTLNSASTCVNTIGNTVGATLTSGIAAPTCGTPVYDIWYKFTAQTPNPTITISGNTNFTNPHIQLLSGACGTLGNLSCSATGTITASALSVGTVYYVRVYSTSAAPATDGDFNICITDPAPANDLCTGAITLTSGTTCVNTAGTVIGATFTAGSPAPACGTPIYDIWYTFTAQTTNPTITISGNTNFINPGIQLLSGTCAGLTNVSCAGSGVLAATGLTLGTVYYVRVYSTSALPTSAGTFNICITDPPPANDDCAGAITLTSGATCVNTIGNTVGATLTAGIAAPTCGTPVYDIWYKFTAQTTNPTITITGNTNFANPHIQVLSGACGSLVNLSCSATGTLTNSGLTIGTVYYVRIYSTSAAPVTDGDFNVCITDAAPVNDLACNAIALTSGTTCVNTVGNMIGATLTAGVPAPACGAPAYDVWYTFIAQTTNPTITISGNTGFINPRIQLLTGTCGSLANSQCASSGVLNATGLTMGTTYYVRVYSTSAAPAAAGTYNICITNPAPANDLCAGAITLTAGLTCVNTTGTIIGATFTAGTTAGCAGTVTYDVWYKFVAQAPNPTITLSSIGANFAGASLQVFSGTCGTLASIACGAGSVTPTGLTQGTTYLVRVYSTSAAPASDGSFNICVDDPAPINDDCSGAIELTSATTCTTVTGSIYGATLSSGVPLGCAAAVTYDVWYSFVAKTTNPTITMSTVGSSFTTARLELYSGSCGALTSMLCANTTITGVGLIVGNTYYIRVYSQTGTAPTTNTNSTFKLCITDLTTALVDYGKSYVNVTKGTAGGTIEPGDVLEIRATFVVKGNTAYNVSFTDNVPANTTYITGSLKILTNEGKTFLGAFTETGGDDAGTKTVGGAITINMGTGATSAVGGTIINTDKPSFYNSAAIFVASYRVTVNAANPYLTKIPVGGGAFSYQSTVGGSNIPIIFPADTILLYNNYGICTNVVGSNGVLSESSGTFGFGKAKNRVASSKIPINYVDTLFGLSGPGDYYYGISNNTSTGNGANPTGYSTLNTWAKPDGSTVSHRVFGLWDIIGDHTGAVSPSLGNPAADTATSSTGGYMVVINASYRTDTAFLDTVKNLCPNTYYQYSAWFRNMCSKCGCDVNGHGAGVSTPAYIPTALGDSSGVHPNLTFNINGYDYYTTGDMTYTGTWVQKGFTYKTGVSETQLIINIRNNAPGGGGNDWAIDDIGVASCYPNTTLTPAKVDTLCLGADDTVRFKVTSFFNNYTEWKLEKSVDLGVTWSSTGTDTTGLAPIGTGVPILNVGTGQYEYTVTRYYRLNNVDTTIQYRLTVATTGSNLSDPDCAFSTTTSKIVRTLDCQLILPTQIVFRGQLQNELANLYWTASSETPNTVYIIERSSDGIHYQSIGAINGNSSATGSGKYTFTDPKQVSSQAYYRIRVTEGALYKYSTVVLLSNTELDLEIKSLVNPFATTIAFDLIVPEDKQATFILTDTYGRIVKQETQAVYKGTNAIRLHNLDGLSSGVYSLQVQYTDKMLTRRVLKMK